MKKKKMGKGREQGYPITACSYELFPFREWQKKESSRCFGSEANGEIVTDC